MKHQYVADVNDYCKYGLLRALTALGEVESMVAWMLTADDASRDGRKLSYLKAPEKWRAHDPWLFDALEVIVAQPELRSVAAIANATIVPGARFHADIVPRDPALRRVHFAQTLALARGAGLLFFDPDNGMEVGSCPSGRSGSEKYLLWTQLADAYHAGHSVLIYQHFPRKEREAFITRPVRQDCRANGSLRGLRIPHLGSRILPCAPARGN